jgi:hypothetical protein
MSAHHYRSPLAPIGICTLLADVRWDRVEAPDLHEPADRPALGRSRHPLAANGTCHELTAEECRRSDLALLIRDAWTGL